MRLSLIVLRSADPERLSTFYVKLGIPMIQERHGAGPIHFAGILESGVIEIYPSKVPAKVTFGLMVKSLHVFTSAWVAAGGSASSTGMLVDPDGNSVHLSEVI
jgi:hypothetical protein